MFTLVMSIGTLSSCFSSIGWRRETKISNEYIIEVALISGSKLQLLFASKASDYIEILNNSYINSY